MNQILNELNDGHSMLKRFVCNFNIIYACIVGNCIHHQFTKFIWIYSGTPERGGAGGASPPLPFSKGAGGPVQRLKSMNYG